MTVFVDFVGSCKLALYGVQRNFSLLSRFEVNAKSLLTKGSLTRALGDLMEANLTASVCAATGAAS